MTRCKRALVSGMLLALFTIPVPSSAKKRAKPLAAADVFKRTAPAVVSVLCLGPDHAAIGLASGFLISADGRIVTNLHVLQRCLSLSIHLSNGVAFDTTSVIDFDERKDLALIRIRATGLLPITIGDSNDLEVGQTIYKFGPQTTLQKGTLNALRDIGGVRVVQLSTAIDVNTSGGPILDDQAHVVAVAGPRIGGDDNPTIAVPINYVKGLLDSKAETPFAEFAAARHPKPTSAPPATTGQATVPVTREAGPIGAGVYRVGGGVKAPRLVSKKEPEYSEAARKARVQGTVVLYTEVSPDGTAQNIRVLNSLGSGLDEEAIEAVRQWKFNPGIKDDKPVTVAASIEVNFRLLGSWQITRTDYTAPAGFGKPAMMAFTLPGACKTEGGISLAFDISAEGVPANIRVVGADAPDMADSLLPFVRSWNFRPARQNTEAMPSSAELELTCKKRR
jgi:TonB family protein